MGGGFWCDIGNWFSAASSWTGSFFNSLNDYLVRNNYAENVFAIDRGIFASELAAVIESQPTTALEGAITLFEGYAIFAGWNTLEYWGEAVGTAAAEATFAPPPGG